MKTKTTIPPEQAKPDDRYTWYNIYRVKKVNKKILNRHGDLVQVSLLQWVYLHPPMGIVKVLREQEQ
jgi:hypothetical protein